MGDEKATDEDTKSESAALIERLVSENNRFQEELRALKQQQDSINAAMTMMLSSKDEEISNLKRKFEEECASYQRLMEEAVEAAVEECNHDWQTRYALVEDECTFLRKQVEELKQRLRLLGMRREGQVAGTTKCSEDRTRLQSIIEPMEQEIDSLRRQLSNAERKLSAFGFSTSLTEASERTDNSAPQEDQPLKGEDIGEMVGLCEQLECYKIQLDLERKHRENAENKLSECALTSLSESAKEQCRVDELERQVQALEATYRQLTIVSESRIAQLIDNCVALSSGKGKDVDVTVSLVRLEARLETERLRHRCTMKRLVQTEEELILMRSVESEYHRLLDRNKELEAECLDLKRQIEVSQQATFRAINTIRSEVERRCKDE